MGSCASKPKGCVGERSSSSKKKTGKITRYGLRRRRMFSNLSNGSLDKPTFQAGSVEETWFDSVAIFESDCDEDYLSIPDDMVSLNGIEAGSVSSFSSLRDTNHGDSIIDDTNFQRKHDGSINEVNEPVYVDDISSVDACDKDGVLLDNCRILPNNCLPCLAVTVPSDEKRRSSISGSPSTRRKASMKLPVKLKEGNENANLRELKCSKQHSMV